MSQEAMFRIKRKGNSVIVYAGPEYINEGRKLARLVNNGNGYTVKFYSWSATIPNRYLNIGYDELEYLSAAFASFNKG